RPGRPRRGPAAVRGGDPGGRPPAVHARAGGRVAAAGLGGEAIAEVEAGDRGVSANVWIVPVSFDGLEDTRKCLRSLGSLTVPASVVVVDNASKEDPTAALTAEFPGVHLVRNPVNGGWSGGNNAGIRHALDRGADYVVL